MNDRLTERRRNANFLLAPTVATATDGQYMPSIYAFWLNQAFISVCMLIKCYSYLYSGAKPQVYKLVRGTTELLTSDHERACMALTCVGQVTRE